MLPTNKLYYYVFAFIGITLLYFSSCGKDDNGNDMQTLPVLSTLEVSELTQTTATSGGDITDDGGATVTARGVVWGISESPTIVDGGNVGKTQDGTGSGSFTSSIVDLEASTTYYVRAYATNSLGTAYGMAVSFKSLGAEDPVVSTTEVTKITQTTAMSGGEITFDGGSPIIARGVCWSTSEKPTISNSKTQDGTGSGSFTSSIVDLKASTTYYVRAYATNSEGTGYGSVVSFKTAEADKIVLTTAEVIGITEKTARSGGEIISEGESEITMRGVVWSKNQNPTINDNKSEDGEGIGPFISTLTSLNPKTTYYVRAYATNSEGTEYGKTFTFTTLEEKATGAIDIDGYEYKTVTIGSLEWFAENLRTTRLNDGAELPYVEDGVEWETIGRALTPAYTYFENNTGDYEGWVDAYGTLYNGYAVDTEKLCPKGWRVPSEEDWEGLITLTGGESIAGGVLKSTHTAPDYDAPRWNSPNTGATDDYGFSAFPSGIRDGSNNGRFQNSNRAFFLSSTSIESYSSWCLRIDPDKASAIISEYTKRHGLAVRCVRDL